MPLIDGTPHDARRHARRRRRALHRHRHPQPARPARPPQPARPCRPDHGPHAVPTRLPRTARHVPNTSPPARPTGRSRASPPHQRPAPAPYAPATSATPAPTSPPSCSPRPPTPSSSTPPPPSATDPHPPTAGRRGSCSRSGTGVRTSRGGLEPERRHRDGRLPERGRRRNRSRVAAAFEAKAAAAIGGRCQLGGSWAGSTFVRRLAARTIPEMKRIGNATSV